MTNMSSGQHSKQIEDESKIASNFWFWARLKEEKKMTVIQGYYRRNKSPLAPDILHFLPLQRKWLPSDQAIELNDGDTYIIKLDLEGCCKILLGVCNEDTFQSTVQCNNKYSPSFEGYVFSGNNKLELYSVGSGRYVNGRDVESLEDISRKFYKKNEIVFKFKYVAGSTSKIFHNQSKCGHLCMDIGEYLKYQSSLTYNIKKQTRLNHVHPWDSGLSQEQYNAKKYFIVIQSLGNHEEKYKISHQPKTDIYSYSRQPRMPNNPRASKRVKYNDL